MTLPPPETAALTSGWRGFLRPGRAGGIDLRRRTGWAVLGQVSYIISQFLILVALARLGTVTNVGQFGLASAIVTPVFWLTDLGLRTNKTTDTENVNSFTDLLALRIITSLLAYLAIVGIAFAAIGDPTTRAILIVFGAAKAVETLSDISYGVFERHGRLALFARSTIIRGVGSVALFTLLFALTASVVAAFLGPLVIWTAVYLTHDLVHARRLAADEPRKVHWSRLLPTAIASRHLGASRFLAAMTTAVPRIIVERLIGIEALGLFTVAAYMLQASIMLMNAVGRSISGHLALLSVRNDMRGLQRIIWRYAGLTGAVGLGLVLLAWFWGEAVWVAAFGPEFGGQPLLLVFLLLAATLRAMAILLQTAPIARRRFVTLFRLRLVDLSMVAMASVLGAQLGGLDGVAAGLAVAAGVLLAVLIGLLRHYRPAPAN